VLIERRFGQWPCETHLGPSNVDLHYPSHAAANGNHVCHRTDALGLQSSYSSSLHQDLWKRGLAEAYILDRYRLYGRILQSKHCGCRGLLPPKDGRDMGTGRFCALCKVDLDTRSRGRLLLYRRLGDLGAAVPSRDEAASLAHQEDHPGSRLRYRCHVSYHRKYVSRTSLTSSPQPSCHERSVALAEDFDLQGNRFDMERDSA